MNYHPGTLLLTEVNKTYSKIKARIRHYINIKCWYNCSSLPKLPLKVAHEWIIPVSPPVKYECDSLAAETDILAIDEITQHIAYDYLTPTNGYMSEYRCERLLTKYGCHTFWTMPSICRIVCSYQSSRCAQNGTGGRFKNTYELLNPRALKLSMLYNNRILQCMGKIFCVEFQRYPLKFIQNILPIHWKMCILFTGKNLRALRFKSS